MEDDRTLALPPDDDEPQPTGGEEALAEERIGPYRLLRPVGEGGMGQVFEAEQIEPIRRRVALKIVKQGMDTHEFVARFESERQALALMDHPCIAKVFDAGASERGRPYFVMEFVEGIPITEYCDQHRLNLRERLELFIQVCEGVQHAHQKAIIHRDLKPSNVLVTEIDGKPVPKIIDFGVAKAVDQSLTEMTMQTNLGQLLGTPAYMSPEQADLDVQGIDTRTDVYALGVLLYEILVGERPFTRQDFADISFHEVLRKIREVEPPRPSSRLTTMATSLDEAARDRACEPPVLRKRLRGDLDWITMKALEKDRARRYDTANALAMDIRRHLRDEPVLAGPPSRTYLARKFVRRHRTGVAAGAFVGLAVLLGIAGTTAGLVRAMRAERVAVQEASTAKQVSDFLVDIFEISDPDQARGSTITAREILDIGAARVERELAGHPLTQARLLNSIGKVYRNLGLYEEAQPRLQTALDLLQEHEGGDELALAAGKIELADLYIRLARYEAAELLLRDAMATMGRHPHGDQLALARSLGELGSVYRRQVRYDEARPLYEQALEIRTAVLGPDHPEIAASLNSLAILSWNEGDFAAAEDLYRQALAIWEQAYGEDHADVARGLNNLGVLYHQLERAEEAELHYRRAIAIYERVLGPEHPRLGSAVNNLALVLQLRERFAEAAPLYERALAIREQSFGSEHPDVAQTLNNLGNLHRLQGRHDLAEPLLRRALAIREKVLGGEHSDVAWSRRDLGLLMDGRGEHEAALPYFEQAVAIFHHTQGPDHPDLAKILDDYGAALARLDRHEEAAAALAESARIRALAD